MRIQPAALEALQVAAEHYLVNFMSDMNIMAIHRGGVTIMGKDGTSLLQLGLYKAGLVYSNKSILPQKK